MTTRERFQNVFNFSRPDDRLPVIEWAPLWNKTVERWKQEGLPEHLAGDAIKDYLGLDSMTRIRLSPLKKTYDLDSFRVASMDDYLSVKEHLYPVDRIDAIRDKLEQIDKDQHTGNTVAWVAIDGFFWFPRVLFGIEEHLYAFYDHPDVLHRINDDLCHYIMTIIEAICQTITPVFFAFNEDMAFNHGPMLSREMFREFLLPYYRTSIAVLKKHAILPFIDCDGFVEEMIPWFIEAGIEGVLPLERQAGVDVTRIRRQYPDFRMLGAYDKMVMDKGEPEMRREFERLLPVMKSGGFIPSCDHQTPPGVSLENYRLYLKLLNEYCARAVTEDHKDGG